MMFITQAQITQHWDKLDKAGFVGKNLLQGKNGYKDGGIFIDCS